jgi:hypothetical protein
MKKLNNCINLGQYPKWTGKMIVWLLKKRLPKGLRFKLYGRGKGSARTNHNYGAVHIRYCKRIAIYVYFYDKAVDDSREMWGRRFNLQREVERLTRENAELVAQIKEGEEMERWSNKPESPIVDSMEKIQAESDLL